MKDSNRKDVAARPGENSYLAAIGPRIEDLRREIPRFTRLGEAMAEPLLAGGDLYLPPVSKFWQCEFTGRAGGLMGIRSGEPTRSSKDVAFFALPDPRRWKPEKDDVLQKQLRSKRQLFVIGRPDELKLSGKLDRVAGFTGGARAEEGLGGTDECRPLMPFRAFEQVVRGWLTGGEMIAACTRAGRMPIVYMSIWFEGAFARNSAMIDQENNRFEPRLVPFFHRDYYIPPVAEGHVASEFLKNIEHVSEVLQRQAALLTRIGGWMAEAHRAGRKVHAVAVGHTYPMILELPESNKYPVRWGNTDSHLLRAFPKDLRRGDVFIHLGYAPINVAQVRTVLRRGVRLVCSSPYGRPADLADSPNLLWLDLPWPPGDASVNVPGYSVRILPMTGVAHTLAYFSILAEMAKEMGWR